MSNFIDGLKSLIGIKNTETVQESKKSQSTGISMNTSIMSGVSTPDEIDLNFSGNVNLNDIRLSGTKYTIKSGDTFYKIASSIPGVTAQMLMDANPGVEPTNLKIGQQINIPQADGQAKPVEVNTDAKKVSDAKQKAVDAKKAFQNSPSGTKKELELQKTFIKEYINWAKTVISSKNVSASDVQDVINSITGLKTYKSSEIKPLQAELNSLVPDLKAKIGTGSKSSVPTQKTEAVKPKTTTVSTPQTPAASTQTAAAKTHTVVRGDTYCKIANDNGISVEELKAANPGVNPANLRVGQKINVPAPKPVVIHSDMPVDAAKRSEYKKQIEDMIREKGVTDKAAIEKLSTLITDKAIEMKVDPIVMSGIVGQECDYLYQSDNIWGRNGKGITQLTYSAIEDLYRLKGKNDNYIPAYYKGEAKNKLLEIFKKYPDVDSLYNAICQKENYELNLEVGIIVFKGKIEIDYSTHPERTERQHLEYSIRNYNGNIEKRASGIEIRDEYRDLIIANYDKHKVS